jgi:hypothetical protein
MIPTAWIKAAHGSLEPKAAEPGSDVRDGLQTRRKGGPDNTTVAHALRRLVRQAEVATPGAADTGRARGCGPRHHESQEQRDDHFGCRRRLGRGCLWLLARRQRTHERRSASPTWASRSPWRGAATTCSSFTNMRTQLYWQFREALDPVAGTEDLRSACRPIPSYFSRLGGSMHYEVVTRNHVQCIEGRGERICEAIALGRSPDKRRFAVVMAWYAGAKVLAKAQPAKR